MSTAMLNKWGNSAGVRIPTAVLKAAKLQVGDCVRFQVKSGMIILEPEIKMPEYKLVDLVAKITPKNCHKTVDEGRPVGREYI